MNENTTASGAADPYPSLYDRTGNIADINTLLVPRAALTASAPAPQSAPAVDAWTVLNVGGWPVSEGVNSSVAQGMLTAERIELGWRAVPAAPKVDHIASLLPR